MKNKRLRMLTSSSASKAWPVVPSSPPLSVFLSSLPPSLLFVILSFDCNDQMQSFQDHCRQGLRATHWSGVRRMLVVQRQRPKLAFGEVSAAATHQAMLPGSL